MDTKWLTGFIEGSGCFSVIIRKSGNQVGYQTIADFTLKLPLASKGLLDDIRAALGIGKVYQNKDEAILKATKIEDALTLVSFLEDGFVSAAKQREFLVWKACVSLMAQGRHHTREGVLEIARLRDSVHTKPLWNKKTYCTLRVELDPCHVFQQTHELPDGCRICWSRGHEKLPLVQVGGKA